MTQTSLKVRILGTSLNAEVPSNATMFATGNNLTLAGDMTRRAIRATLDAGVERPELRAFDRDPLAMVAAHRGDYVTAGLTILRAFHVAGRPSQTVQLGSFTAWSAWVRDALIWLGEADPCETMEGMRGADPKLEALTAALEEWRSVIGTDRVRPPPLVRSRRRAEWHVGRIARARRRRGYLRLHHEQSTPSSDQSGLANANLPTNVTNCP